MFHADVVHAISKLPDQAKQKSVLVKYAILATTWMKKDKLIEKLGEKAADRMIITHASLGILHMKRDNGVSYVKAPAELIAWAQKQPEHGAIAAQ